MQIGIGADQPFPNNQGPSNGWQLAYAWATTVAPSVQTTQRQDASINNLVTGAQASANAPTINTSSSLNTNVSPTVVNAQAITVTPVVDTSKSPNVLVPIASAQENAIAPSVSTGATLNASISSVVAGSNASAGTPAASTTSGGKYLTENGAWANSTLDENGSNVFSNMLNAGGEKVFLVS
jgi:hypothetical protein